MKRWQIVSNDAVWMFPPDVQLSTVEMRRGWIDDFGYQYESCLFYVNGDSVVIDRYETQEEAVAGHNELEKKYKMKRCSKLKIYS